MKLRSLILVSIPVAATVCGWFLLSQGRQSLSFNASKGSQSTQLQADTPLAVRQLAMWRQNTALAPGAAQIPQSVDKLAGELPASAGRWLAIWKSNELSGKVATLTQISDLRDLIIQENVGVFGTIELIHTIGFHDGAETVGPLVDLALEQAKDELSKFSPPDATAKPLIDALWPLHDLLWDTENWGPLAWRKQDEQLLKMLKPWLVRGSGRSQAASFAYSENIYMQQRFDDAYAAFQQYVEERKVAFEPSQGVNRDVEWELGLCLYYTKRYAEAAPHLRAAAANKGFAEGAMGWPLATIALARSGNADAADKTLDEWIVDRKPSVKEVAPVLREIEKARSGSANNDVMYMPASPKAKSEALQQKIEKVRSQLDADPRGSVTVIFKDKPFADIVSEGAPEVAAELALRCIIGQPDRIERVEYFLNARTQALLAAKKYPEALASAKSYFNCCAVPNTPKAITLMAQCLTAAYPKEPGKSKRFLMQQLASAEEQSELGEPILKGIQVEGRIYDAEAFALVTGDVQRVGQANLLLMQDQPDKARAIFDNLTNSPNPTTIANAKATIARAIKAKTGSVAAANAYLLATQQPTTKPTSL